MPNSSNDRRHKSAKDHGVEGLRTVIAVLIGGMTIVTMMPRVGCKPFMPYAEAIAAHKEIKAVTDTNKDNLRNHVTEAKGVNLLIQYKLDELLGSRRKRHAEEKARRELGDLGGFAE